jgi:hypothetical protein
MAFKVFLSHSTSDADLVGLLVEHLTPYGITCYVAERDWKFGTSIEAKLEAAVRECDCVLALLTANGDKSSYVHQELGVARNMKRDVVPVVEPGVDLKRFQAGLEYLTLNHEVPGAWLTQLSARLTQLKASKEVKEGIFWALAAVAAAVFLQSK